MSRVNEALEIAEEALRLPARRLDDIYGSLLAIAQLLTKELEADQPPWNENDSDTVKGLIEQGR